MHLERVLQYAKTLIKACTGKGDIAIDATIGNGHDSLFLSKLVGESGHVYGYDIQKQAIEKTRNLLDQHKIEQVTLFHKGHEYILDTVPSSLYGNVSSAIFNLGYLPGSDKTVTTKGSTTIKAINQLLQILKVGGIIVLVVYHGHPEGQVEKDELLDYVSTLNQKYAHVLRYQFVNQKNHAPFIIAIEKVKEIN
ncbi:tRNA (mnm(5)s(2)U34)-methyltransferase [Haloplasma contractile]|uniref:Trans-aconitate 2-methyltransferase protein n=1 Tax=Haloplasma contractile SSD-17B TaxID=1033810 RepID=U2FKT2_9MOLU|nr:class I SAM-dependent methyltransferase [Haloplasma contractile]ERJ13395.1 trans-aconitate 2-methyltransferase protein [Haloplasma contractile SSD-17B]